MRLQSYLLPMQLCVFLVAAFGCSDKLVFQPVTARVESADAQPLPQDPEAIFHRFKLILADGKSYVRRGVTQALTQVYRQEDDQALQGADADSWKVGLKTPGLEGAQNPLGLQDLDLSGAEGQTTVDALFLRQDGLSGRVRQSIFVDGIAPQVSLLELMTTATGEQRTLYWSAVDNYLIQAKRTTLYACLESAAPTLVRSFDELQSLPASCTLVANADMLAAKGDQITVGSALIGGNQVQPINLVHYIYGEDMVGIGQAIAMTPAAQAAGLLTLNTQSIGRYSNKPSVMLPIQLESMERGQKTKIDGRPDLWPLYTLYVARSPDSIQASQTFSNEVEMTFGAIDGPYTFTLFAQKNNADLRSNHKSVQVILDTTPPVVSSMQIQTVSGVLEANSPVTIAWNADDLNGVARQTLEIQLRDKTEWIKVSDLNGTLGSHTFLWGNRPTNGFTARIIAEDVAGNIGIGVSQPWRPQIFNAAVLTSSVNCFYCHTRIEGDVAGINFPATVRDDTGLNFSIVGRLFATNAVPQRLKSQLNANDVFENYDNSGIKMFPSEKDANGVPVFPTLEMTQLRERMNGTVVDGLTGNRYSRVYTGNLILSGTQERPILLNGEFAVTGDLIIKGVYKGVGSLYAKNVFVVDDLVSFDCTANASNCPFPFTGTDAEKLAKARNSIKNKQSALYLAGLVQTNVGAIQTSWESSGTLFGAPLSNPYDWLATLAPQGQSGKNYFESLCTPASDVIRDGNVYRPLRNTRDDFMYYPGDARARCEVSRVDAYLYGHDRIAWRAYNTILINGGFVGYRAAIVSSFPKAFESASRLNPVPLNLGNGLPVTQNVIRYDWRLRAGGPGFESLKALFDQ